MEKFVISLTLLAHQRKPILNSPGIIAASQKNRMGIQLKRWQQGS
jgi:hypothetical protein